MDGARTAKGRAGRDDPFQRAHAFIEANLAKPISLDELSAAVGMSKYHLVRVFHARFGHPPLAYQKLLRLRRVRDMLRAGRTIREAVAAAGFSDASHLTREFKRAFGVTPGRFRRGAASGEGVGGSAALAGEAGSSPGGGMGTEARPDAAGGGVVRGPAVVA